MSFRIFWTLLELFEWKKENWNDRRISLLLSWLDHFQITVTLTGTIVICREETRIKMICPRCLMDPLDSLWAVLEFSTIWQAIELGIWLISGMQKQWKQLEEFLWRNHSVCQSLIKGWLIDGASEGLLEKWGNMTGQGHKSIIWTYSIVVMVAKHQYFSVLTVWVDHHLLAHKVSHTKKKNAI